MKTHRWLLWVVALLPLTLGLAFAFAGASAAPTASLSGVVVDEEGTPLGAATVRVHASTNYTLMSV